MRGKVNSMFFAVLAAMVMSWGRAHAQSFAYDLKVAGAESASLTFGRLAAATDAVDAEDIPAPPAGSPHRQDGVDQAIPVEGVINYMYLQGGQGNADSQISKVVGDAYYRLSEDYKSLGTNASTWVLVIADTVDSTVPLSWTTADAGAAPADGTFQLTDAAGAVKVADLRTTASVSLAKGTYYIQYQAQGAAAPPTPAPLRDAIAKAAGLNKDIILDFDPALFTAGDLQAYYYNGDVLVDLGGGTRAAGAAINGNVLTFTMPDDISGFDTVVINYTLTRTGAGDGAPTATGAVELVSEDIIELDLTAVAVGGAPADISADPIKVKVDYTDAAKTAYQPITVQYELTGVAETLTDEPNRYVFTGPAWKGAQAEYPWTIAFDVTNPAGGTRTAVVFTVTFTEDGGVVTPTYTADVISQTGQVLTVTLQPAVEAKGNTIDFAITALEEGQETANVFTTPAVTFQLKGDANLDVDGDGAFDYPDVRLIFNFAGDGSIDDGAMIAGTMYGVDRAAEFRQKIDDMVESLDIDGDGGFDYPDVRLIFNYAGDGSIDNEAMVAGTIYPVAWADEFRTKISDMIEQ